MSDEFISVLVSGKPVLLDVEDALRFVGVPLFVGTNGYAKVSRNKVRGYIHREIAGAQPGQLVDHINGNPLDNRRKNLRVCTDSENNMNKRLRSNNTTGICGVWFDSSRLRWSASIGANKKSVCLGRFDDLFSAAAARKSAELKFHGEFSASLGVLNDKA